MQILTYETTDLKMEDKIEFKDEEKIETFSEEKENEKANQTQLQEEVVMLKENLEQANKTIHRLQSELTLQQGRSNHVIATLQLQLQKNQETMKKERIKSDRQLGEVLAHLLFLEGRLEKEQKQILAVIRSKDQVIQKQKKDIEDLTVTNQRLIEAVREHYSRKNRNGLSIEHTEHLNGNSEVPPSPKVKDKHKTPHKGAFGSMKDKFWKHHRSSLDLSDTGDQVQGNLSKGRQYSSQENLFTSGKKNREAREIRDKKCKSIAGYPNHSLEHLIPEEGEIRSEHMESWQQFVSQNGENAKQFSRNSVTVNGNHDNNQFNHQYLALSSSSQLMSAISMPILTNQSTDASLLSKERPHSISSIESLSQSNEGEQSNSNNKVTNETNSSQSESNPFKNLKTILKRRGSKMKNKKRTVSMSQQVNEQEEMKKHFQKYKMS